MCTVSFVPKGRNYLLAMNRDELFSRGPAQLPQVFDLTSNSAVHPSDAEGGTWVAVNDFGIAFTILNWNSPPRGPKLRSRGEVIIQLLAAESCREAEQSIRTISMAGMRPFRLVGFFPIDQVVREWRWNGAGSLESVHFDWQPHHWFSSGLSDEQAADHRSRAVLAASQTADSGSQGWLRSLHSSHLPERGAFSVCVHRDDAATLSYTEISVAENSVIMCYRSGSPCLRQSFDSELSLPRRLARLETNL